ncbi:hypothetical protein [Jannaschia donghaensis]|uniref:Protocatechuate 3,4-dioxygenase alpha chain n=1 Tax=Jannaschia donghaensis TaxID=420998 RepID=A0A0M6YQA7_9RHOB|nr:hypothetical protein [Jannaschia donghaensis]CTQ51186.1 Protocatechuate 3,4-dioxygenase alpha chain [Jannaschia donghaensis]
MTRETASQTAGPYLHIGLLPAAAGLTAAGDEIVAAPVGTVAVGQPIAFRAAIVDGMGAPVTDALVELWQIDGAGHGLWRRSACDGDGHVRFETVRPAALPGQAPHLTLWIVARGIGLPLQTRAYFDDASENNDDPVLARVPAARRKTLMAHRNDDAWTMNIALQGADETVFFNI